MQRRPDSPTRGLVLAERQVGPAKLSAAILGKAIPHAASDGAAMASGFFGSAYYRSGDDCVYRRGRVGTCRNNPNRNVTTSCSERNALGELPFASTRNRNDR